ncbi:DUF2278 family protein, partial [Klebsiella pneumoniae]|uniref:DUF2278 family protein n=1 Tax=Klebsiella pneumoniae TaxID=573 RepID=UPI004044E31B
DVAAGFTPLAPRPDSGALDFIRGNLFDPQDMTLLPPTDEDGSGRDLNDLLAGFVNPAIADRGAEIFAFGTPWGPEENADKVFG